ncbi:hypothetical protein E1A91_A01G041600v1 [Gossypium mustelinum]|uniref:Protein kinase domain-containing protein n=1 Tax=Gossypium mustelinum TaxID=34275 RepID=A0A5D3A939_GOSMU|nr:hypothetical protein E1A91_A01G041600v1 [Gossypium mustelinum]TYJ48168.1 hypothetical protein E1A91_A01G041600v1 [Gossypium mustelinum]
MPKLKEKLPLFALFVILFPGVCFARHLINQDCGSTFCGNLNISFPFRMKGQSPQCGYINLELECENNNRTTLVGRGGKFFVQEILYEGYTMRVVDASMDTDDCNSLPLSSVYYSYGLIFFPFLHYDYSKPSATSIIYVVNCTKPIKSLFYIEASRCITKSNTPSLPTFHFYFLNGNIHPSDINQACTVEAEVPVMVDNITSMSTLDIYKKLQEGFWLSWNDCTTYQGCHYNKNKVSFKGVLYDVQYYLRAIFENISQSIFYGGIFHYSIYYARDNFCLGVTAGFFILRALLGIPCLFGLVIYKWSRRHLSMDDKIEEFLQSHTLAPIRYSFKEIKKMTKNFKYKLGEGGYGSVFKGKLRSGHYVAIKLLGKSKGNGQDFINEVASIGRIHHVNVAKLIGFSVKGSKQALVYEFMSNGSLDKIIFSEENKETLGWKKMFDIVLGVARGIDYLHQGCDMQILHFDIKPHNILLDENFNPKVSDFGLAKLYSVEDSIVSLTVARGTIGYIAPELVYKNLGGISYKADVYSFGMLLMEMVGRRKNLIAFVDRTSQIYFPSWIYDRLDQGEDMELGDVSDDEKVLVKKMIIIAFWCIQLLPIDRPSMSEVLKMLEGDVELLQMPPKPFHQLPLDTSMEVDGCESSVDKPSTSSSAVTIINSNA